MTTSYAQTHLGKTIDQLEAKDLVDYFAVDREESLTLEFKSFYQREGDIKHKESGVMRAICAFLNSSGGLLIWGAPIETKRSGGYKVCSGPLSPVEKRYAKDEFVSKLSTKIIPFASPALFRSVEIEEGKYVYLFDVPESEVKPHQFDDRYFIRLDGQSKAAPHYVIDALFKQVKKPVLDFSAEFSALMTARMVGPYQNARQSIVQINLTVNVSNLVKEINEHQVFLFLKSSKGQFVYEQMIPNDDRVINPVIRENAINILPYGLIMRLSERLLLNFEYDPNDDDLALCECVVSIHICGLNSNYVFKEYKVYVTIKSDANGNHRVVDTQYELVDSEGQSIEQLKSPLVRPAGFRITQ
ncbi:AlbA family DNA-binding domain-containing protein [Fibrella aquatica]|uniref:AlbA family DNA-binding domain-containing protein n=1 Tax=Fibrella aquatica TaxID=3242487 RepID=UPI003521CEBE